LFRRCREEKRAALILYVTAGFPDLETTARLLPALESAGADLIELGVPFSDPIADGPTIQRASTRALAAGATLRKTLQVLESARKEGLKLPVILFGAYNPFLHYGLESVVRDAKAAGADGFLSADLPVEEADEFQGFAEKSGLYVIFLAAPTTPEARLQRIGERTRGFLYCIAVKGVTGARQRVDTGVLPYLQRIRRAVGDRVPLALGFGISKPDQVRELKGHCDAIVVGSALISTLDSAEKERKDPVDAAAEYTRELAAALRG